MAEVVHTIAELTASFRNALGAFLPAFQHGFRDVSNNLYGWSGADRNLTEFECDCVVQSWNEVAEHRQELIARGHFIDNVLSDVIDETGLRVPYHVLIGYATATYDRLRLRGQLPDPMW